MDCPKVGSASRVNLCHKDHFFPAADQDILILLRQTAMPMSLTLANGGYIVFRNN